MKNCYKYENDEIRFVFDLSEKEAYILASMMQKNVQSDSHLWKKLACSILNTVNDGYKNTKMKFKREIYALLTKSMNVIG